MIRKDKPVSGQLLFLARNGDVGAVSDFIYHIVHFPTRLRYVKSAIHNYLHSVDDFENRVTRAKLLESLVRNIMPLAEDEERFEYAVSTFIKEESRYLDQQILTTYKVFSKALSIVVKIERPRLQSQAFNALSRAFTILTNLILAEEPSNGGRLLSEHELSQLDKAFLLITERIFKMDNEYWKVRALKLLFMQLDAAYSTVEPDAAVQAIEAVLTRIEEARSDRIKVMKLKDNCGLLNRLRLSPLAMKMSLEKFHDMCMQGYFASGADVETTMEAASSLPVKTPPRYVDFCFFYAQWAEKDKKVRIGHTLKAGRQYRLEVAVREKPTGIPVKKRARRRKLRRLSQQDTRIMVVLEAEDNSFINIEEPVQVLILPPMGDSKRNAYFDITPLRKSSEPGDLAKIRVRMYYEFNLIEVAVISAEVAGGFDDPSRSQFGLVRPICFKQERLENEYIDLENILPRMMHIDITKPGEYFCFNFAFFNEKNKKLVFSAPIRLTTAELEDVLLEARNTLYDIATSETFTSRIEGNGEEFGRNIRRLAMVGRKLWLKLFKLEVNKATWEIGAWLEEHPLRTNGVIQVSLDINAACFVFPWALVYDRALPTDGCELPEPEGFWGMRYCIEQRLPDMPGGNDSPIDIEERLDLAFMLWEQFRNVNDQKLLLTKLGTESNGRIKISTPPITKSQICFDLLRNCDSHVLYFYTHGYTHHRQADLGVGQDLYLFKHRYEQLPQDSALKESNRLLYESISQEKFDPNRSWIELTYGKIYLDELYDNVESLASKPLVILNMCESAQITPSLRESFLHFFINRGAKAVIGTECPMTIEFAHPFSEHLFRKLFSGKQIGSSLLSARQHFMKLNNPLGLAYTLVGSATVRFKPSLIPNGKSAVDSTKEG